MMTLACAAVVCGSVRAELNWNMGEGVTFDETPIVSTEVGLAFDSKFLSYGLVDNNDPILTPHASMTWFETVTFGVMSIFDISRYGRKAGYGNRAWRYQELDPSAGVAYAFTPDEVSWLPTTVELDLTYMYEQHPRVVDDDTQFLTLTVGLPDLWFEPAFAYERDIDRDDGTYQRSGTPSHSLEATRRDRMTFLTSASRLRKVGAMDVGLTRIWRRIVRA